MPFEIVRNDITQMRVDAIVNTANPRPIVGGGTDAMLHSAAGEQLLQSRQVIGDIAVGCAAITPAFALQAKYVLHTVGPIWVDGKQNEEALLRSCYDSCLRLAAENGCKSIAFPLISTGTYGFPKDKALQIAIAAFSAFLLEQEMEITLVVYDKTAFRLSEQLFQNVASYIDENYVESHKYMALECASLPRPNLLGRRRKEVRTQMAAADLAPCCAEEKAQSLEEMLKQEDAGFTETLLRRIDESGKKDSEIYKKALLSKQHFSKIRNNPHYKPTKSTALSLALALELDLEGTRDLLGRAGYALTNSSKFDLIIRYFIEQGMYNVVAINCVLFEHDQSLLGS